MVVNKVRINSKAKENDFLIVLQKWIIVSMCMWSETVSRVSYREQFRLYVSHHDHLWPLAGQPVRFLPWKVMPTITYYRYKCDTVVDTRRMNIPTVWYTIKCLVQNLINHVALLCMSSLNRYSYWLSWCQIITGLDISMAPRYRGINYHYL